MRFSAQEEYGLRCLLQIAGAPGGFLTIKDIADREALTVAYVAKIMRALRKGGLVVSTRGQKGGYALTRSPREIDVAQVLEALGGPLHPRDFCRRFSGTQKKCVHDGDCSLRSMWVSIDRVVHDALSKTHLADLLKRESPVHLLPAVAPPALQRTLS